MIEMRRRKISKLERTLGGEREDWTIHVVLPNNEHVENWQYVKQQQQRKWAGIIKQPARPDMCFCLGYFQTRTSKPASRAIVVNLEI